MKFLIAGIGNIGPEYAETRHNIGFKVLDAFVAKHGGSFSPARLSDHTEIRWKGKILHCIKPTTYVNRSGRAVKYWLDAEKIQQSNVLVIVDDLSLPYGTLRLKQKGSDAGHNGLKDINIHLSGQNYPRLRFGIGNEFGKGKQVDYVLGEWTPDEKISLESNIQKAVEAIEAFVTNGIERAMNLVNTKESA